MNAYKRLFLVLIATTLTAILWILPHQQLQAQEMEMESQLMSYTEFTIKPNHSKQFEAGVKAWKDCYLKNDGERSWSMWSRMQGEGTVYTLTSYMGKWAIMDETSKAGEACESIAQSLINPTIKQVNNGFSKTIPALSRPANPAYKVVSVRYWRVKNGTTFRATVDEVERILKKAEGEHRAHWYSEVGGGMNAPHYYVVWGYPNFAAMDNELDSVWDVVEQNEGKKKREELQNNYRASMENTWLYMYHKNDELSHNPESISQNTN